MSNDFIPHMMWRIRGGKERMQMIANLEDQINFCHEEGLALPGSLEAETMLCRNPLPIAWLPDWSTTTDEVLLAYKAGAIPNTYVVNCPGWVLKLWKLAHKLGLEKRHPYPLSLAP
jgi:hypothetical protein